MEYSNVAIIFMALVSALTVLAFSLFSRSLLPASMGSTRR